MKVASMTSLMLLFGLGSPTLAVTLVTDQTTFLESNPIVSTETFEEFGDTIFPGQSVTIDSVTYTDTNAPYWGVDNWFTNTSSWLFSNATSTNTLTFGKNQFVNAIGFSIIPFVRIPEREFEFEFKVEEINGAITSFFSVPKPSFNNFFGFSSTVGIKTITVLQPPGQGGATNFAFDDVSRSGIKSTSVPEPSSVLSLLAVAVLGSRQLLKNKQKAS